MTGVYYFSGSGHSRAVAAAISGMLHCGVAEIGRDSGVDLMDGTIVVVFPVYCQNIPAPVKTFLRNVRAEHVVLIAVYGKISYGNVLYEAKRLVHTQVIAGAYIPMGHTFLSGDACFDEAFLLPIVQRIRSPQKAHIPKSRKNLLADVFPALRSRLSVKITKNDRCDNCGTCEENCPAGAIRSGKIHSGCIRCMRCVSQCPRHALQYKNIRILQRDLERHCKEEYVLYL